jgi:hypothetical protein
MLPFYDNHSTLLQGYEVGEYHLPHLKQYCYFISLHHVYHLLVVVETDCMFTQCPTDGISEGSLKAYRIIVCLRRVEMKGGIFVRCMQKVDWKVRCSLSMTVQC